MPANLPCDQAKNKRRTNKNKKGPHCRLSRNNTAHCSCARKGESPGSRSNYKPYRFQTQCFQEALPGDMSHSRRPIRALKGSAHDCEASCLTRGRRSLALRSPNTTRTTLSLSTETPRSTPQSPGIHVAFQDFSNRKTRPEREEASS